MANWRDIKDFCSQMHECESGQKVEHSLSVDCVADFRRDDVAGELEKGNKN